MASDFSGLIPVEMGRQIIQEATEQSASLRLGAVQRMSSGQLTIPVLSALPTAGFITAPGTAKPATEISWTSALITAEEVAAVLPVPRSYIDDAAFNIWGEIRPRLAEAIAKTVDNAIIAGVGAPPSFPVGGVLALAAPPIQAVVPPDQPDIVQAISDAMQAVENSGLDVTGFAARSSVRGALRSVRTTTGEWLVWGPDQAGAPPQIFGSPLIYSKIAFGTGVGDLIAGDWTKLVVGLREDMRFDMSTDGVLRNPATGAVTVSAFQDDVAIMRVYMRVGVAIGRPVANRPDGTVGIGSPFKSVRAPAGTGALNAVDADLTGSGAGGGTKASAK